MNNLINKELQSMKYLFNYQKGKVISEQTQSSDVPPVSSVATPTELTPSELITQIQTVLKTKYGANLGTYGVNKDGIDGKWGNATQTALENVLKITKPSTQPIPLVKSAPLVQSVPSALSAQNTQIPQQPTQPK